MLDPDNELNDENFSLYALRHYKTLSITPDQDFRTDLKSISIVSGIINRYDQKPFNLRALTNKVLIVCNIFGSVCANGMLFYKVNIKNHGKLRCILDTLNLYHGSQDIEPDFDFQRELLEQMKK